jgi:hypothetical protein
MQHIINEDDTSGFEKYHEEMENFISKSEFAEVDTSSAAFSILLLFLLSDGEHGHPPKHLKNKKDQSHKIIET